MIHCTLNVNSLNRKRVQPEPSLSSGPQTWSWRFSTAGARWPNIDFDVLVYVLLLVVCWSGSGPSDRMLSGRGRVQIQNSALRWAGFGLRFGSDSKHSGTSRTRRYLDSREGRIRSFSFKENKILFPLQREGQRSTTEQLSPLTPVKCRRRAQRRVSSARIRSHKESDRPCVNVKTGRQSLAKISTFLLSLPSFILISRKT